MTNFMGIRKGVLARLAVAPVKALSDYLDLDALAVRTSQRQMISANAQVNRIVERCDLTDRYLGSTCDSHVHDSPTRLPCVVELNHTAGFAGSNIVEGHRSPKHVHCNKY